MLEIILGIGVCVMMVKIAAMDGQSAATWGLITFGLCFLALFIPLPFLRMLIAGFVAFGLMIAWKVKQSR